MSDDWPQSACGSRRAPSQSHFATRCAVRVVGVPPCDERWVCDTTAEHTQFVLDHKPRCAHATRASTMLPNSLQRGLRHLSKRKVCTDDQPRSKASRQRWAFIYPSYRPCQHAKTNDETCSTYSSAIAFGETKSQPKRRPRRAPALVFSSLSSARAMRSAS